MDELIHRLKAVHPNVSDQKLEETIQSILDESERTVDSLDFVDKSVVLIAASLDLSPA